MLLTQLGDQTDTPLLGYIAGGGSCPNYSSCLNNDVVLVLGPWISQSVYLQS